MIMKVTEHDRGKTTTTRMLGLSAALLVATAGPLATASCAAEPGQPKPDAAFQALDQNKDGKLTAVEVTSNMELSRWWTEIDKDDSGTIDQAEFSAFEAMQQTAEGHPLETE
jgi:hypothetical protein